MMTLYIATCYSIHLDIALWLWVFWSCLINLIFYFQADAAIQLKEADLTETILELLKDDRTVPEILCNTLTLTKTICSAGMYMLDFIIKYSKTCLKWPLKKKTKIGFQDQLLLNAGQKYCKMLQESILQYFQPSLSYHLSLRPLFCLFLSGRLRQVLLYAFLEHTCIKISPASLVCQMRL